MNIKKILENHKKWLAGDPAGVRADLREANLREANLREANLKSAQMPTHHFQAVLGGIYWKGIGDCTGSLSNQGYTYKLGMNTLHKGETFADDQRETCSYPGFHIATREWVLQNWSHCKYLVEVQVPLSAKINNPWATDGKASVDRLVVLGVYDMKTGEDLTEKFTEVKKHG